MSVILATATGPEGVGAEGSEVLPRFDTSGVQAVRAATAYTPTAEAITPRRLIIRPVLLGWPALLQQLPW